MKFTLKISTILLIFFGVTACDGYLEDEIVSPNDPEETTPELLMANVQVATFATYTGQLVRQSLVFSRQLSGTNEGSQSAEIARYNITELTNENEWEVIWAGAVVDCKTLINDFGGENPYYGGIAKVILALNYGVATDLWGDVPIDEAGLGPEVDNQPQYESQEQVLMKIQTLLDDAIADLSQPVDANFLLPGPDDLIFGGNINGWLQAATILKARYANRLSEVNPSQSATEVIDILQNGNVSGSGNDAFMPFFGGNAANQWAQFEADRAAYYRVSEYFANLLTDNNDPRTSFFLAPDGNGGFSGTPFDDQSVSNTSYVGPLYAQSTAPLPLVTFVEAKFLEAEAQFRLGANEMAAQAHNDAVEASIVQVAGEVNDTSGTDFIDNFGSETASSITMEKIMIQKSIALFIQIEVYADQRRTGIPQLEPNPAATSGIPVRLPTPQSERLYNNNAIVVSNVENPVYWDQ